MIYFTSDPHFGHKKVIGYCNRPYETIEEMDAALIANWNKVVKPQDTVFVLGDFAFTNKGRMKEILFKLNGKKILVKGNHDKDTKQMLEAGFDRVIENERIKIGGTEVLVSHFPYHPVTQYVTVGSRKFIKTNKLVDDRYLYKRILDEGKLWLLHGHVHTAWKINGRMINVGVDQWNYTPVSEVELLKIIKGQ